MKKTFTTFAAVAAAATALSMPLAGSVLAATDTLPMMVAANDTVDQAKEEVSDTWITGKVKSSFLADDHIKGTDIKVETNKGVVSLSGMVNTDAQRELAIEKAQNIKGVKDVSADGLKAAE
ncbi:hyperosmotically inducible protein [Pseudomonas duriflava]|uniref:Osmotically-inducible protein Y n=1 Tax=Pseudomonas duriflava TaxID=459528 RepID=A0A562Q4A7_9PSED|nr:BON domain-containing protein [Pseudomonas duriflava]TWI50866.1 hyperosmotically inducible protein [Pseudomonas duriflava]